MIYVTGDLHGRVLSEKRIECMSSLFTSEDKLIIAGDFGYIWGDKEISRKNLEWLQDTIKCEILFIDGNHEDFDTLREMEKIEYRYGAKIGKVGDRVYHLLRNKVYTIEGKRILTCGGARSLDKDMRQPHVSWWREEFPTPGELVQLRNLFHDSNFVNSLDFVISHEAPTSIKRMLYPNFVDADIYSDLLSDCFFTYLCGNPNFTKWYFGHLHEDTGFMLGEQIRGIYHDVVSLN